MRPEVRAAYQQFLEQHHGVIDHELLAETIWNASGRWHVRAMTSMSDLLPLVEKVDLRIHQVLGLLEGMLGEVA